MAALSVGVCGLVLWVTSPFGLWLGVFAACVSSALVWFGSAPELRWAHASFSEAGVTLVLEPEGTPDAFVDTGPADQVSWSSWTVTHWPEARDERSFAWTELSAVAHGQTNGSEDEWEIRLSLESGKVLVRLVLDQVGIREGGRVALAANKLRSEALRRSLVDVMATADLPVLISGETHTA